jgi:hypothetical protein
MPFSDTDMNDDPKEAAFQDSGAPEVDSATPALKTWMTPKVITSTLMEGTEHSVGAGSDGGSPSGAS